MNYANDAFQNGLSTRSFEQAAYALYFAIKYDFDNGFGVIAGVNNIFGEKYNVYQNGNSYIPAEKANYYVGAKYEF